MEGCLAGDSNQSLDQHQEAKELQGTSDTEVCVCVCPAKMKESFNLMWLNNSISLMPGSDYKIFLSVKMFDVSWPRDMTEQSSFAVHGVRDVTRKEALATDYYC